MSSTLHDVHVENVFSGQVGTRVAEVRTALKMTQAELAQGMSEQLGKEVRPLTVTRLEGGKRPISVDELRAAAETLRVPVADLMAVDEDLDFEALAVILAAQEKSRAKYNLARAVREWLSADAFLATLMKSKPNLQEVSDGNQMFIATMYRTSFERVIEDAQRDWGKDGGAVDQPASGQERQQHSETETSAVDQLARDTVKRARKHRDDSNRALSDMARKAGEDVVRRARPQPAKRAARTEGDDGSNT